MVTGNIQTLPILLQILAAISLMYNAHNFVLLYEQWDTGNALLHVLVAVVLEGNWAHSLRDRLRSKLINRESDKWDLNIGGDKFGGPGPSC